MSKKYPKTLWGTIVSYGGVPSKPIKVSLHEELTAYGDGPYWYDKEGNFEIRTIGLEENLEFGCSHFASEDKAEVETFIAGAQAVMTLLRHMTWKEEDDAL